MTYVISDIHGLYDKYTKMLEKIKLAPNDVLYVLGDVVDRGPEPMKVLQDMSMRSNVIPIVGNHDYIAYDKLRQLLMEYDEANLKKYFGGDIENFYKDIASWFEIGGETTLRDFGRLSKDERQDIVEYISEFSLYETVKVNEKKYILTHAGLPEGATQRSLGRYDAYDFVTAETDYNKIYFDDAIVITGHLPTFAINETYRGRIYRKNNHIAIDTGAVFGEALSCVCIETDEEFYV